MALLKVWRSSQNAARNGCVRFDVGSVASPGSLFAVPQPETQVLPPNSSQPFVEIATVVYPAPSIVTVNGIVAVASASLPERLVKPLMSSGLYSIHAASDEAADARPGVATIA